MTRKNNVTGELRTCCFGTDGIRGRVGHEPMVPDTIVRLGYAIGTVLGGRGQEVIVGKDTRLSGYMLESAIEAGLAATGIDIALTGPLPTSAVARLVAEESAAAGIVISASHNPYTDNGIKVFDAAGKKLSDEMEKEIEVLASLDGQKLNWVSDPGKARRIDDATQRYVEFCLSTAPKLDLSGLHVVVDAANGAAYTAAPAVMRKANANVQELGCQPDGRNINAGCGAQEPELAVGFVTKHNFDLGIVLDGDADRLILVDATGRIINGDAYLYAMCYCLTRLNRKPVGVVGTLMSNISLETSLSAMGIKFVRADVGDRYVAQEMLRQDFLLGGEASGHILLREKHVTGDGLIAALAMLELLAEVDMTLEEVVAEYEPMPSFSCNLSSLDDEKLTEKLLVEVAKQRSVTGIGRIIMRPSGTEPVVRVLVEAQQLSLAKQIAEEISKSAS